MSTEKITLDEFQSFVDTIPLNFTRQTLGKEYIYKLELEHEGRTYYLQILSSIDTRSDESRYEGVDAIRVRIVTEDGDTVVRTPHTKRTSGWDTRVREKMKQVYSNFPENLQFCDECGRLMVIRSNDGIFYGCSGWDPDNPACTNTMPID